MNSKLPSGGAKQWGGRFAESPDARLEAFNASIFFDQRMAKEDIRGSIAHVRMLGAQGIVTPDEAAQIESGLWQIMAEVETGTLNFTLTDEDIHTGVERRLREHLGAVAGKLHTGRSRNDQAATSFRLWTVGALQNILAGLLDLRLALTEIAERHPETVMPGYTHLQRAQPVLLGHHLLAYEAMLSRDSERVRSAIRSANVSPLGSAALAGTSFPINRQMTAADLGFDAITTNSMDAVADRDYVCDALYACSMIAMHISRLSEEVCLWATGEFRFITLSDAFSTGSSIMPQKKNPDVAELARGKSGRVFGHLMAMLTVLKGTPLAYNKDFQEDKEALFDAVDTVLITLDVVPPMMRTATWNSTRMAEAAIADFSLATDAADLLARNGVPFREAHEVVGQLVGNCVREYRTFADLSDAEWAAIHPVFAKQRPPLRAIESVAARDIPGGTAPRQVAAATAQAMGRVLKEAAELDEVQQARAARFTPPAR